MNTATPPRGGEGNNGLVEKVRERATAQLSTQKDRATDGLGSVAHAVRATTQTLRDNQQDTVAQYAEKAADQIERLSERLKNKDVTELLNDAQRVARQQPALFIGGAFALGLVGARFLKSSRSDDNNYDVRGYGESGSGSYGSTAYIPASPARAYTPPTTYTPPATSTPSTTPLTGGSTTPLTGGITGRDPESF